MFSSGDILLCPVIVGTKIVKRVITIPGSKDDSKICMFLTEDGKITHINSAYVLPRLRVTVEIMGKDKLGFFRRRYRITFITSRRRNGDVPIGSTNDNYNTYWSMK